MTWRQMLSSLDSHGVVEFGMHQMDLKSNTRKWRRHKGGSRSRFNTLRNSLLSHDKGARVACLGRSTYAQKVHAAEFNPVVPYVGTWLQGSQLAFLVRAAAAEPEVTLVSAATLNALKGDDHSSLLASLGQLFGVGAQEYGVRLLASGEVYLPR